MAIPLSDANTSNILEPVLSMDPHGLGDNNFHFYRCDSCNSILTHDDEKKSRATGTICVCGSGRYSPTNPTDEEWDKPKVKAYCETNDIQPCYEAQL